MTGDGRSLTCRLDQLAIEKRYERQRLKETTIYPLIRARCHRRIDVESVTVLPKELILDGTCPLWIRGILAKEEIDIVLSKRSMFRGRVQRCRRAVRGTSAWTNQAFAARHSGHRGIGGDTNDIDEILALSATSLKITKDNWVVAELLALGYLPLPSSNAIRPNAQQDRHLARNPNLSNSSIDERDYLVTNIVQPMPSTAVQRRIGSPTVMRRRSWLINVAVLEK